MSEPDHVAVMKRAKELCARDGFVWWDLADKAEQNPLQELVSDNRRQEYMARARDQLRRDPLAAGESLHNPTELVPPVLAAPRVWQQRTWVSASQSWGLVGDAGASAPPGGPRSRIARTLKVIRSAARSGWMAPTGGLALIGLAAWLSLHLLPTSGSLRVDTPAAALPSEPSPRLDLAISPGLPAGVTEPGSKRVAGPSAPLTQASVERAEHKTVKWHRLQHRRRFVARRTLLPSQSTPEFADRCPYQCSWAEAMRGGGDD